MSDTDIILSVDLDVADADRTAEQLHKEIQRIFQSRNGEQSASLTQLELQMKKNVTQAQKLRESLKAVGDTPVATERYSAVLREMDKLEAKNLSLMQKMTQFEEAGGNIESQKYQEWSHQYEKFETRLKNLATLKARMESVGTAYTPGAESEEYRKLQAELDKVNDKLKQQVIRHNEIAQKEAEQANKQGTVRKQVSKTTQSMNALRNATERVRKSSNKTTSAMSQGFSKVNGVIKNGIKTLLMWGLGIRGVMALVNKLRSAIKEGFSNLEESKISKYTEQINNLRASFAQMKNALAGAFEPIVTSILPYLQRLVDWLTIVIDKIAQFIAALRGQKTYIKAIKQVGSAVKETGKAISDAADDANRGLASFDKLNNMTSQKNKDSGGGAGIGGGAGSLFEESVIDSKIFEWVEKFRSMLEKLKKAIEPTTNALKKLWNEGLSKLRNFTWTALKDFWENFLVPLGKWAFGTENKGFPRLINILNDDLNRIDWETWNENLKNFWIAIEPYAEAIGEGLIDFLEQVGDLAVDVLDEILGKDGILSQFTNILKKGDPEKVQKWTTTFLWLLVGFKALEKITEIWLKIKGVVTGFIDWLPGAWATVKGVLLGIGGFVTANPEWLVMAEGWLEEVSPKFRKFVEDLKYAVDKVLDNIDFTGFEDACKVIGDAIVVLLHAIEFLLWPKTADKFVEDFHSFEKDVQKLLDDTTKMFDDIKNLFSSMGKLQVPLFNGGSIGTNAGANLVRNVSWHAAGGVIPPTASPHLIGVGDNNRETEVISPLSTIEQALRNVFAEQNINVTFEVQGDPNRIFNVVRKESQTFNKSHGYSAFA